MESHSKHLVFTSGITLLVEIRRERDLWSLQPAFRLSGEVSWPITAVHSTAKLRYTAVTGSMRS